ncbi:C2H2 finger domain protein [Aspergillus sp. HF37]|nr:C2H2 finger domain protein [Aspergillus sp. HF37]
MVHLYQILRTLALTNEDLATFGDQEPMTDFPAVSPLPVPTLGIFKAQIREMYPRLEPALVDRFANVQSLRYENLVQRQEKHSQAAMNRSCRSGKYCFALGGDASLLPRAEGASVSFRVMDPSQGLLRLPARFECPICFEVKEFQKPYDWSIHVLRDVWPFTCTFPNCSEPKSFKRKADWVRHEVRRHRQPEWWACSYTDCSYKAFRKDTFTDHLVHKYKMLMPNVRMPEASSSEEKSETQRKMDKERLWEMVKQCRHSYEQITQQEQCQFCGVTYGNWKALLGHVGSHLEHLALSVLEQVN